MSEKHDVTKSSNPDVQVLLVVIAGLGRHVERLMAEVAAIRGELASLPQQYVVPGPNGEAPAGTLVVNAAGGRGSYVADDQAAAQASDPYAQVATEVLGAGTPLVGAAGGIESSSGVAGIEAARQSEFEEREAGEDEQDDDTPF